jgi:mediator of RNA polymerase II transcription subunit 10
MVRITLLNSQNSACADRLPVHLRSIISNLFYVLVEAHDFKGQGTKDAMTGQIKDLIENLQDLSKTSRRLPTTVPLNLIQYVEGKRNPDVYKRQIVEMVQQYNQLQSGRSQAFASFRDILGREMMSAIPDIREDVKLVLEASGGSVPQ